MGCVCGGLVRNSRDADWLGQMPVPPPSRPPSRPTSGWPRGAARGCAEEAGGAKLAGGVTREAGWWACRGGTRALRASRAAAPPPGPYAALSSSLALSGCSLSSHSWFHAAASLSCERQPRGHCVHPRAPHLAHPTLPTRAHLAHGHTFVSPSALGSRRRADGAGQHRSGRRGLAGRPWRRMGLASR